MVVCSCVKKNEPWVSLDDLPQLQPFVSICGRYLGATGADSNIIELSFKPKQKKENLLTNFDQIAKKEGWVRSRQSEQGDMVRAYTNVCATNKTEKSMWIRFADNGIMFLIFQEQNVKINDHNKERSKKLVRE